MPNRVIVDAVDGGRPPAWQADDPPRGASLRNGSWGTAGVGGALVLLDRPSTDPSHFKTMLGHLALVRVTRWFPHRGTYTPCRSVTMPGALTRGVAVALGRSGQR